jgi:hypothetical protein
MGFFVCVEFAKLHDQPLTYIPKMLANQEDNWQSADWLADARSWIEKSNDDLGFSISGELDQIHVRAWSTVIRVPTSRGNVFFKAGGPNQAFEAGLLMLLQDYVPDDSLQILALDERRDWVLLADGGETMRQAHEGVSQNAWKRLLGRFAQIQIKLGPKIEEFLKVGVPDRRLSQLPGHFDHLLSKPSLMMLGEEDGLAKEELEQLWIKKPILIQLCNELAAFNLPSSLDHGDLHDANVFIQDDDIIFFDFGDASISHPFISLMIPLRILANKLGLNDDEDSRLDWARHAYLEPWLDFAPMNELLLAWELAHHVGKFQRAINWHTVSSNYSPEALGDSKTAFPGWLREFLYHGQPFPA